LMERGLDGRALRRVQVGERGRRASGLKSPSNIGWQLSALVDVEHVAQQEVSKHRASVAFRGMKRHQRFVHPVMSDAIRPPVQTPPSFPKVTGPLAHDDSDSGGASVKHHALNHFFTPRA
jgi:hypothetical protein